MARDSKYASNFAKLKKMKFTLYTKFQDLYTK